MLLAALEKQQETLEHQLKEPEQVELKRSGELALPTAKRVRSCRKLL
jgi:hypothetical protein